MFVKLRNRIHKADTLTSALYLAPNGILEHAVMEPPNRPPPRLGRRLEVLLAYHTFPGHSREQEQRDTHSIDEDPREHSPDKHPLDRACVDANFRYIAVRVGWPVRGNSAMGGVPIRRIQGRRLWPRCRRRRTARGSTGRACGVVQLVVFQDILPRAGLGLGRRG